MTTNNIHSRAMLVAVRISMWTARKFDRKVSDTVNEEMEASKDAGRYNKHLMRDPVFQKLLQAAERARMTHYQQTLPWSDEGWRLLPSANYFQYCEKMRKERQGFEECLRDFLSRYSELCAAAKDRLGKMYRAEDYPPAAQIAHRFAFSLDFSPLPAQGDFRVDLPSDQLAEIEKSVADRVHSATQSAMEDAWARLQQAAERIHDRLADPENIFRDSLVYNVRELCDVLGRLNVTRDSRLEEMRKRVEELMCYEPQDYREDEVLRQQTAKEVEGILKNMAGILPQQRD